MLSPASFLPDPIRGVLSRKSSRDPFSCFSTKLHLLLRYSSDVPTFQARIGVAWVTDDEFRMNKTVLSEVMGITVNTLNVNLRDLHFQQLQRDQEGWTRWKHANFTRWLNGADLIQSPPTLPFQLAHLTEPQIRRFDDDSHRLWTVMHACSAEVAIDKVAVRFRYGEQPFANSREVIGAIIRPSLVHSRFSFADFGRFFAMFGPAATVMPKIASLVACSNVTGKWLTFEHELPPKPPFASFDLEIPNCLVVKHADGQTEKIFNIHSVESGADPYLVDDSGKMYKDWDEWFTTHPFR
jgi:hypothetical protein